MLHKLNRDQICRKFFTSIDKFSRRRLNIRYKIILSKIDRKFVRSRSRFFDVGKTLLKNRKCERGELDGLRIVFKWTVEPRTRSKSGAAITNWLVAANKNSITLRLLSKSSDGPFSSGLPAPDSIFFSICSLTLTLEKILDDAIAANWLLTLVTRSFSLFHPPRSLALRGPTGPPNPPPPLRSNAACCTFIFPPDRSTQLCFCVQINLRRVKNGKRQSFRLDSNCFAAFQADTSSSRDKRSDWLLTPSSDVDRRRVYYVN